MTRFSILDLVPVIDGGDVSLALRQAADFAQHVEALGFDRYWVAEHHGMEGIAGGATAVVLAHIGAATSRIRLGAGGIMLPNHSPFIIAEQFGTLDALYPGRIDLGLGRAPGSDGRVAQAIRRGLSNADEFPRSVIELRGYFTGDPDVGVVATPGRGANINMWILGSSTYGAQLAAALGMPYAFASQFAPNDLDEAIALYRAQFRPSAHLSQPYVMLGYNVFAAETDEEAHFLASSMQQSFVALRFGSPGKLQTPVENYVASLDPVAQKLLRHVLRASSIGSVATVTKDLRTFIERTQADEIMIAGSMYDHEKRKNSATLVSHAVSALQAMA
jgi:luciferase family oxidoreductase group 1